MLQFSIRKLLLATAYCAIGFTISSLAGFEYFLWINLMIVHVSAVCILSVAAIEYTGYRRRFCVASLAVLGGFLVWMFVSLYDVVSCNLWSIIGLAASYYAGLVSAGAYRAITTGSDRGEAGPMLNVMTRTLAKVLSRQNQTPDV